MPRLRYIPTTERLRLLAERERERAATPEVIPEVTPDITPTRTPFTRLFPEEKEVTWQPTTGTTLRFRDVDLPESVPYPDINDTPDIGFSQRRAPLSMPNLNPLQYQGNLSAVVEPPEADTPWYKEALGKITTGFDWVQENLEKPWASAITSPFSPVLSYRTGEGWLEHEKREYDNWKAPKFVKGLAEFTMPLWWLPYFGWSAKAAGVIPKIGGSLAKGIGTAERIVNLPASLAFKGGGKVAEKIIKLPAIKDFQAKMFTQDRFRTLAERLSKLPGFKTAIGTANPSAVARGLAEEGLVVHNGMSEIASNAVNATMPRVTRFGNARNLFGIDDLARATKVVPLKVGDSVAWADIFAKPTAYKLSQTQRGYIKEYSKLLDEAVVYAEEMGIKIKKRDFVDGMRYIPRRVEGKMGLLETETGVFRPLGTVNEPEKWIETTIKLGGGVGGRRIGAKPFFQKPRLYEYMEDGIQAGVRYGADPNVTMDVFLRGIYKSIVDKTTADMLKPLGKTVKELTPRFVREDVAAKAGAFRSARNAAILAPRAKRGEILNENTLRAVERFNPDLGQRLREAIKLPSPERNKALTQIRKDALANQEIAFRELSAARRVRARAYEAARSTPGYRAVGQPFASGRLFPEPIAKELQKYLTDTGQPILSKISSINALSRFMVTGFDFGAGMIQGVPLLMSHPIKWAKAMKLSVSAFADDTVRARYFMRPENQKILQQLVPEGMLIGESEFMESVAAGGLINKLPETMRRLTGIQRWANSFNTFGDVARVEWAKALLPMAEASGRPLRELTAFINEATGVISSRALGVGATQREIEAAILFAPRYFRANMALWSDIFRGNLRGALARDTLASMIMGGFFWYYGIAKALGQEPNLDPSSGKFMTVEIGGQHIGLGSMQVAAMRLLGNIYKTASENPNDFLKLDSRDNPLVRFMRTRVSPIGAVSWDVATGKTFIGEPLDKPLDIGREEVASRMLPFWLASYVSDYPKPGASSIPSEIFGLRTWPLQLWERRDELRDQYAKQEFGKPWYSTKESVGINEVQKKQLESEHDDLKSVTDEAESQRVERAGVEDKVWFSFKDDRKRARTEYEGKLWAAQQRVDSGEITPFQFKELAQEAGSQMRGAYRNIEANPRYGDVMTFLNQPMTREQIQNTPIEDVAFDYYMQYMFGGDLEDASGEFDFGRAEMLRSTFIGQWGQEIYDYVVTRLNQDKDIPPLMQEYYKAREVLRPYWQVQTDIERQRGKPKNKWQAQRIQSIVSRIRKFMKLSNPEMERYYSLFYTRPAF